MMRPKNVYKATSLIMALGLVTGGAALADIPAQAASAAPSQVTIPEPAMSSLDPIDWAPQIVIDQGTILEGLYGYNDHYQVVPKIATGYKVTDGGRVWTIYLRHNAKWSNGQPVTAEDFYYAWMRLASPAQPTSPIWAGVISDVRNIGPYHAGDVPASAVGLTVPNPYTLQLTLTAPQDILPQLVLAGSMPLYPPVVEKYPTTWFLPQHFVGDGPYIVKSFVENGEVQLVRNLRYVGAPHQVNVGNVHQINLIPAPSVPVEDYLSKTINVASIGTGSDYKYVESHSALKSQLHTQPNYYLNYLEYDKSTTASPLDNSLVRQAIAMAINRAPMPVAISGLGVAATAFGPKGFGPVQYEHALPYNVKDARALLAKAGYPNGKGIPQLTLYTQTTAGAPQSVLIGEILKQELKSALNINFQIDPTNPTQFGSLINGGLNQGVRPGYAVSVGVINWLSPPNLTLQAGQMLIFPGTLGPAWYRDHIANWYLPAYDPNGVAKYGNPNDSSLGISAASWSKLNAAVVKDNAYLTAWTKKQPALYQQLVTPLPGSSRMDIWNRLVAQWKSAKTNAAKHAVWVTAWKFVSNYSEGSGATSVGLDGQVYIDQHEPTLVRLGRIDMTELNSATTTIQADKLAADIANLMMSSGYVVPLLLTNNVFLESPTLHGALAYPFFPGGFSQLQYLQVK